MDDVDRTFERLRRPSFQEVCDYIAHVTQSTNLISINPVTFDAQVWPPLERHVRNMGWTPQEFNDHINKK